MKYVISRVNCHHHYFRNHSQRYGYRYHNPFMGLPGSLSAMAAYEMAASYCTAINCPIGSNTAWRALMHPHSLSSPSASASS